MSEESLNAKLADVSDRLKDILSTIWFAQNPDSWWKLVLQDAVVEIDRLYSELAAKDARIAELATERDAKHDEMMEALRDQRVRLGALHDETSANLRDMQAAAKAEIERLSSVRKDNEALRKQLAEFGAGEDTTTMTRKSFAEVLQALADATKELATLREQHSNVLRENECQRQELASVGDDPRVLAVSRDGRSTPLRCDEND